MPPTPTSTRLQASDQTELPGMESSPPSTTPGPTRIDRWSRLTTTPMKQLQPSHQDYGPQHTFDTPQHRHRLCLPTTLPQLFHAFAQRLSKGWQANALLHLLRRHTHQPSGKTPITANTDPTQRSSPTSSPEANVFAGRTVITASNGHGTYTSTLLAGDRRFHHTHGLGTYGNEKP